MFYYAKDGVTVSSMLDDRRANKSGLFPVKIRVTYQRKRKYYATGKSLSIEDWARLPDTKVRSLMSIRRNIENSFNIIRDIVEDLTSNAEFSFGELNIRLGRGTSGAVHEAYLAKIESLKADGHIGNMKMYETFRKGILRFAGERLTFESITIDWLKRYERFLLDEGKSRTTIGMHFRTLRAIVNEARKNGIVKEKSYPFGKGRFEIQEGEGRKLALTLEQIGKIYQFKCDSPVTERYRDYWMFLYFCNGINVADFIQLKYCNIIGDEICFVRQKTKYTVKKQKEIHVTMLPQMQQIIDHWGNPPAPDNYLFPILKPEDKDPERIFLKRNIFTRELNKRIKVVSRALGFGNISTYTARHSFATVLKRSGANIAYISESLGHSDLKTTESYLASFEKEERRKNASLLTQFDLHES